jgi:hypothetical protein
MGGTSIVPKILPGSAFRPELDHELPHDGMPILIRVLDRRDNRRSLRALHDDAPGHDRLRTGATARRRKRARRAIAKKGTAARQLDQFYTRDKIAARYLRRLAKRYNLSAHLLVEPSAGGGAFSRQMPVNTVALDRDPSCPGILKADFLEIRLVCDLRIITVGNPPFGRNACLAVDFFNHAAGQSEVIAMIFPRSFLKAAIENRLDCNFHRVHSEEVPPNAFELDGEPRDVGAVFQIWERRPVPRKLRLEELGHPDFEFSDPDLFDFLIRRVGANAGKISHERDAHEDSHYFIKGKVEHIMRQLDLTGAASKATSTPSLAKSEIVSLYRRHVERLRKPSPRWAPRAPRIAKRRR